MAILKCKMCGGDLNITADEKIVECEFCGTTQTIPDGSDEKKTNLFNRANRLRIANEFDKASGIYESIIAEFPDEAESYWGLCLCKFGIEYVDDPKTAKKIPTCHRTSFDSIFDDENYKMAIEKSDVIAQGVYKEEATVIDNLQKDILSIVHKEEPFDVFICYKETDELGGRTQDSVLAQDVYDALTDKGFKVFFSRITLEDKLGKQYEPYIFAALNSAKVMLAIGTKEEYYNAVWVKNEWSRYLALMESDKSKMLIPCYRDIDPYDMPQEFKNLQGQDMSKLGFLQDLVRGVSKIIAPEQNKTANAEPAPTTSANATVDSLLKRAFMFLEDGNWKSAEEYCEKVLDINPECAEAYLGKLMAELHVKKQEDLRECQKPFDDTDNYLKLIRFGNERLKTEVDGYVLYIKERNHNERIEKAYSDSINLIEIETEENYRKAIETLSEISYYRNSKELLEKCQIKLEDILSKIQNFQEVLKPYLMQSMQTHISAGGHHTIGLKKDSTPIATMFTYGFCSNSPCDIEYWKDIVAISAGYEHTVGLKADGTVITEGDCGGYSLEDYYDWENVIAISAGWNYTVGLKKDGTVIAIGENVTGQCNVSEWKDIVAISAGMYHTVGLKKDGTVVSTEFVENEHYKHNGQCNVAEWKDIVAVSAGVYHTVGLKADGTVIATKYIGGAMHYHGQCDVSEWKDIVAISAHNHTIGLRSDGSVVAVGCNYHGQCDVSEWKDIVAISAGYDHTVGLKIDGTAISTKYDSDSDSFYGGQCEVAAFRDILLPNNADLMKTFYERVQKEREEQKIIENEKRRKEEERRLQEKLQREKEYKEQEEKRRTSGQYRHAGLCQYCGGTFKGLFSKTCVKCGKKKDY